MISGDRADHPMMSFWTFLLSLHFYIIPISLDVSDSCRKRPSWITLSNIVVVYKLANTKLKTNYHTNGLGYVRRQKWLKSIEAARTIYIRGVERYHDLNCLDRSFRYRIYTIFEVNIEDIKASNNMAGQ